MPVADQQQKQQLDQLTAELDTHLQKLPESKAEEGKAVAASVKDVVEEASKKEVNRPLLGILIDALKSTAKLVADAVPPVVTITTQIGQLIGKIHGTSTWQFRRADGLCRCR
jgi:hypothetical protein